MGPSLWGMAGRGRIWDVSRRKKGWQYIRRSNFCLCPIRTSVMSACPDLRVCSSLSINIGAKKKIWGTIKGNYIIERVPVYGREIILVLLGDLCIYGLLFLKQP